MARILAGHFQLQEQIEQARRQLVEAGFPAGRISAFYVNQPGQHDVYALGGDRDRSPGAAATPDAAAKGMATGGVVGTALGAATAPLTGPVGPLVGGLLGAHVGSLYSLHGMKEAGEPEDGGANRAAPRHAGMLLAVALADEAEEARVLSLLRGLGAEHLERAEGDIVDGDWRDFDPLATPQLLP